MSRARYARLPNPRSEEDAEREMDAAFGDDDDDAQSESTPLTHGLSSHPAPAPAAPHSDLSVAIPQPGGGAYDFERDYNYDYPPPGSPPGPSPAARPNDIGNSNGAMPTSPIQLPFARPSFFRRAVGALLPQHYQRVPTEPTASRARGGGAENDGVFANVMAKPTRNVAVRGTNGEVHMVPEETQKEAPPTYNEAQADAVPGYWDTTVHAPATLDPFADMIVEDLPTGSVLFFVLNAFISYFFQFIGFLLTYLLHTSHAAKHGSRAGLGMTLIQYGFYSRSGGGGGGGREEEPGAGGGGGGGAGLGVTAFLNRTTTAGVVVERPLMPPQSVLPNGTYVQSLPESFDLTTRDWLAFLLMTLGWFLLLSSVVGFYRVKRWEKSIRASANAATVTPGDAQRDVEIRQNIERVFGFGWFEREADEGEHGVDENEERRGAEPAMSEAEERLRRDLRAAGLI